MGGREGRQSSHKVSLTHTGVDLTPRQVGDPIQGQKDKERVYAHSGGPVVRTGFPPFVYMSPEE